MMKSHFCSILHKKTHKRLNEKDFELDFCFSFLAHCVIYILFKPKLCNLFRFGFFQSHRTETNRNYRNTEISVFSVRFGRPLNECTPHVHKTHYLYVFMKKRGNLV